MQNKHGDNRMKSYSFGIETSAKGIQYAEMEFNAFIAREVLINGKPKGEYHVKPKDDSSIINVCKFFQTQFAGCDVGLIDPDGLLNLEYPIYILISEPMILNSVVDIFRDIDKGLTN
jgi:hypothetical protein